MHLLFGRLSAAGYRPICVPVEHQPAKAVQAVIDAGEFAHAVVLQFDSW